MLDKSIPYADILMYRPKYAELRQIPLPDGFRFSFFKAGDEKAWAQIEASVLEFDDEIDALLYFQREFLPYLPELMRRCMFVETADGEKVATCTAWWDYTLTRRDPWLYWFAVKPQYQGKGLGKALAAEIIRLMLEIEGDRDLFLHTQTWSHKAVKIYESLGYQIIDPTSESMQKAMAILNKVYKSS